MKPHRITVESKPGRAPKPTKSRWSCSCGLVGTEWTSPKNAHAEADAHTAAVEATK